MADPKLALLVAAGIAPVLAVLLWPRWGLWARLVRWARASERVRIEDALKHVYRWESEGGPRTAANLSTALKLSPKRGTVLVARLSDLGLVETTDGGLELTAEGRRYALRVVRIHRLWERFLSDETDVPSVQWHTVACKREHETTLEQANRLAARMGFPQYDPHGDPIPSADGEVPPAPGMPITELEPGQHGEVVHIEDEPEAVYAQLMAEGLALNMRLRMVSKSPERIRLEADGEEHVLAPVVAANLSVVPMEATEAVPLVAGENLAGLLPGQQAVVTEIAPSCRGLTRRRLLDLGVLPGSTVEAEMRSAGGDPTAYRIRGALIALRREQAELIQIERPVETRV